MDTTVGQLVIKSYLPKSLHHLVDGKVLDKKGISDLFGVLSEKHADIFNDVASHLARFGFEASTRAGSSVSLDDLKSPVDKDKRFKELEDDITKVKKKGLSAVKEHEEILNHYFDFTSKMDKDIVEEGVKSNKILAKIIRAGTRGSAAQYRSTVASPGLVTDKNDEPFLEFPIKHSFAEGLSLPEYLATSYGARKGEVAKKLGTAMGGFVAKQLSRAAMTVKVEEHDCGTDNGVSYPISDNDSIGAFLAKPVLNYKKNNEVTSTMLADLANKKIKNIIVRSPITCQASRHFHSGAVCQLCVGMRENGLPTFGSFVGIIAASSISEPLSQSLLSSKHSSGTASKANISQGFDLINQLANIPKNFPGAATIADHAGKITDIKKAEAGGHYLKIDDVEHYVNPGFELYAKKGDEVEKGDVLSEGIVDPSKIIEYKGIGEGRKHYVETMNKAFRNSGIGVNRRNFEIIAKNAIDHVRINDHEGLGDYLPDQVVSYQAIEKNYKPREDSKLIRIDQAKGKYLEEPTLHYSIGTPITTSIINTLKENKIDAIQVHDKPPGFEPVMVRLLDVPEHEDDIMHQLYSTYLQKRLTNAVNTGVHSSSDLKGSSPIAGIAYGVGFGSS